jgi:hypothetical protein
MRRTMHLRPSAGLAVAALGLMAAVAGTAVAGESASTSAVSKKKVKKIAVKQVNKLAPGLSVASADTAESAGTATTADSAQTANTATNSSRLQGASLASIAAGNDAFIGSCEAGATFVQCGGANGGAQVTLTRPSKVLAIYGWRWSLSAGDADGTGLGTCQTTRNGAATSGDITMGEGMSGPGPLPEVHQHTGGEFAYGAPSIVDVQGPLQPGTYRFGLRCMEEFGDIDHTGIRIAALVMGTG